MPSFVNNLRIMRRISNFSEIFAIYILKGAFIMPYPNRLYETNISNRGQKMRIVAYRNATDIDVEFEDGTVVEHRTYRRFKEGHISNPNYSDYDKVGEENISNYGQKMKVIACHNLNNIDIQFEDGTIVTGRRYSSFKKGSIFNPNLKRLYLNQSQKANNGQLMKIIEYKNANDIVVEFEDGTITKTSYRAFRKGSVANPNVKTKYNRSFWNNMAKSRIGETNIASCGMEMTIVEYNGANDIIVEFKDGARTHTTYSNFKSGIVKNKNISKTNYAKKRYSSCFSK